MLHSSEVIYNLFIQNRAVTASVYILIDFNAAVTVVNYFPQD